MVAPNTIAASSFISPTNFMETKELKSLRPKNCGNASKSWTCGSSSGQIFNNAMSNLEKSLRRRTLLIPAKHRAVLDSATLGRKSGCEIAEF